MHDVVAGCIHGVDINPMASCLGTSTSVRGLHKIGAYFPCPIKVWLNGHEWAKRPATQTALATGFASCDDQGLLLRTCNSLCPVPIQAFFDFWLARLPLPLTAQDRSHGCYWDCRWGRSRWRAPWCRPAAERAGALRRLWRTPTPTCSATTNDASLSLYTARPAAATPNGRQRPTAPLSVPASPESAPPRVTGLDRQRKNRRLNPAQVSSRWRPSVAVRTIG
jgi:hypothetical protein